MQTTHFKGKCEFAAILACALGLIIGGGAHAQAPAPAKAPAKAAAAAAPAAPAAAAPPAAPPPPPPAPAAAPAAAPAPQAATATAPPPAEFAPQASPLEPAPVAAPIAGAAAYPLPAEQQPVPWGQKSGPRERPLFWGGYEISLPMGDLRDFSSKPSYRGFEFGTLWPVFRSLYVGGVFDYHVFYEEEGKSTYQLEPGAAITANLYRLSRFWSFAAISRYMFLKPDSVVRPFVGLRMGMSFLVNATLVADLSLYDAPVGFLIAPEAGFLARVAPVMDLSGSIRYDFSTASVASGELHNASFLAFQFALVFHPSR